jgi:hypothetical protein
MSEYKTSEHRTGGGVETVITNDKGEYVWSTHGSNADKIIELLQRETAPLHAHIAELEAAIESAIATAETLLDEPSPYNKVGESIAGWLRRALAKKAGGND